MKDIMSLEGIQIMNRGKLKRVRPVVIRVSEGKISICAGTAAILELDRTDKVVVFEQKNEWYISKTTSSDENGFGFSKQNRGGVCFTARNLARQMFKTFGTGDLVLKPTEYSYKKFPAWRIEERISVEISQNGRTNH